MTIIWKFKDSGKTLEFASFPYALRSMLGAWRRGIEGKDTNKNEVPKRSPAEMAKAFTIVGPCGTSMEKSLSYQQAIARAKEIGIMDNEGNLNGKEFKQKKTY